MESVLDRYGIDEKDARERIRAARENAKWFNDNVSSFRTSYKKKFVAVHEGQILDSDDHFDKLQKRLKESHKDLDVVDIQYVPSKDAYIVI